jgi:hypothetical protein
VWIAVDLGRGMGHYRWALVGPDGEVASYHCHLDAALGHGCLRSGRVPARPVLPNHLDCRCPQAIPIDGAEIEANDPRSRLQGSAARTVRP